MDKLPADILRLLATDYLTVPDIGNFIRVSRRIQTCIDNKQVWWLLLQKWYTSDAWTLSQIRERCPKETLRQYHARELDQLLFEKYLFGYYLTEAIVQSGNLTLVRTRRITESPVCLIGYAVLSGNIEVVKHILGRCSQRAIAIYLGVILDRIGQLSNGFEIFRYVYETYHDVFPMTWARQNTTIKVMQKALVTSAEYVSYLVAIGVPLIDPEAEPSID